MFAENLDTMASDGAICTFEQYNNCGMEIGLERGWNIVQSSTSDHTTGTDQGNDNGTLEDYYAREGC